MAGEGFKKSIVLFIYFCTVYFYVAGGLHSTHRTTRASLQCTLKSKNCNEIYTNNVKQYIFYIHIWFGENNKYLSKIINSCCVGEISPLKSL